MRRREIFPLLPDILSILEIYAREILPLSISDKRSLSRHDGLFCLEIFDHTQSIGLVELSKYVIKEQYDGETEVCSEEGNFEIFHREEECFIFSTREVKTRLMQSGSIFDKKSEVIEVWSDVRMT